MTSSGIRTLFETKFAGQVGRVDSTIQEIANQQCTGTVRRSAIDSRPNRVHRESYVGKGLAVHRNLRRANLKKSQSFQSDKPDEETRCKMRIRDLAAATKHIMNPNILANLGIIVSIWVVLSKNNPRSLISSTRSSSCSPIR
jgi:hypothetical protein